MVSQSKQHKRHSIRLKDYDYTLPGAYFVTICTYQRECLFGDIVDEEMRLNEWGERVKSCWLKVPSHFPHATLDAFIIMPNHVHGIIVLNHHIPVGANNYSPLQSKPCGTSKTIGSIVRGFKIGVTKWFQKNSTRAVVWQRNYYEHIIRDETSLNQIREYIQKNPSRWESDENNPMENHS